VPGSPRHLDGVPHARREPADVEIAHERAAHTGVGHRGGDPDEHDRGQPQQRPSRREIQHARRQLLHGRGAGRTHAGEVIDDDPRERAHGDRLRDRAHPLAHPLVAVHPGEPDRGGRDLPQREREQADHGHEEREDAARRARDRPDRAEGVRRFVRHPEGHLEREPRDDEVHQPVADEPDAPEPVDHLPRGVRPSFPHEAPQAHQGPTHPAPLPPLIAPSAAVLPVD
jgi:hypothetical protein